MRIYYGMQADEALTRKYGRCWWDLLKNPDPVVRRVEQRIYEKRNNLTNWLTRITVSVLSAGLAYGGITLWEVTHGG